MLQTGKMTKDQFFDIAYFSYSPHKMTGKNTNFRFFKHFDPVVMQFIKDHFMEMNQKDISSLLFLYGHNMWEAQERFTHSDFFEDIFSKIAKHKL